MGQQRTEASPRCLFLRQDHEELHELVAEYIESELIGRDGDEPRRMSDEDERAMALLPERTKFMGDRYEAGLLWASDEFQLPCNRKSAEQRHESLQRKLRREPEMRIKLDQIIDDYLAKGYATEVNPDDTASKWFLPVFSVKNPSKPDKVRLVMDGAAETDGVSLNSNLLTGPDLNASLVDVLIRAIKEQHYVDDYLDSWATAEDALAVAREVKFIHQRGGFNLHKFVSNDPAVTRRISEEKSTLTLKHDS